LLDFYWNFIGDIFEEFQLTKWLGEGWFRLGRNREGAGYGFGAQKSCIQAV